MTSYTIKVSETDKLKVQAMFTDMKNIAGKVMSRAINKTLPGVKTDASSAIRAVLNVKKSTVDKTFKTTNATPINLSASFRSTGEPIPLIGVNYVRQTAKGVSVKIQKDKRAKVIPSAFIATMKSGHRGVMRRNWSQGAQGKMGKIDSAINRSGYIWSAKLNRYISIAWLPKEYRLPIEERFAPRVPDYLGDKGPIMQTVLDKASERLHKKLEHELNYELSKITT